MASVNESRSHFDETTHRRSRAGVGVKETRTVGALYLWRVLSVVSSTHVWTNFGSHPPSGSSRSTIDRRKRGPRGRDSTCVS